MNKFKFNWGHGVILVLASFMLFILTLIFLADETGDLVSDDYYEDALVYQELDINARNRASALAEKPEIHTQANGFRIQFPTSIKPDSGQIYMMRGAFKSDDIHLPLELNSRNEILIPAARMKSGEYDLNLGWYVQGNPYLIKQTLTWNMP
ncbi:MAG: FixH family protein [Flavobacteriaceae bacterium]|nr:FixH family protein [Flavobacteriaceae bacterium]